MKGRVGFHSPGLVSGAGRQTVRTLWICAEEGAESPGVGVAREAVREAADIGSQTEEELVERIRTPMRATAKLRTSNKSHGVVELQNPRRKRP